ncbi:protein kinase domain-containing protein, partial [Haematococcus lacustris]
MAVVSADACDYVCQLQFYMAPELLRSGRASKASDVFSFGITAWDLTLGHFADLKPENILLQLVPSSHPQVSEPVVVLKVCDFGLSSRLHPDQSHISNVRHGTFLYMAPELLRSGRASKASDVFSFGITAWELGYQRSAWKHYLAAREASHGDGRAPHMLFNFTLPLRGGEDPAAQHPDT